METEDFVRVLRQEGLTLIDAARRADVDADVPTCSEWDVRELVRHIGAVHEWATRQLVNRMTTELEGDLVDIVGGWPADAELFDWAATRHADLVDALEGSDPDFPYWTWRPAPSPITSWARRQAHETAIHRADADAAAGRVTVFDASVASDGVDELILDVVGNRGGPLALDSVHSIAFVATDTDERWFAAMGPDGYETRRGNDMADCSVAANASDLYRLVWHRADLADSGVSLDGDPAVRQLWWELVAVRWT